MPFDLVSDVELLYCLRFSLIDSLKAFKEAKDHSKFNQALMLYFSGRDGLELMSHDYLDRWTLFYHQMQRLGSHGAR
jgi:hypothetical protein